MKPEQKESEADGNYNPCDDHAPDEVCDFCSDMTECIYCHAKIPFGCVECDKCEDDE